MPNFKESEEKAIVFKSGSKKDKRESREKSMRQKSGKSTKSTSKSKSTKSKSKKKSESADKDAVFDGTGSGQLKAKSALKPSTSNFSNSLTSWSNNSQTSAAVDAPKQSSSLDSQSSVLIKHKSTADQQHHMLIKPKSSGIAHKQKSKSSKRVTRPKSAPKAAAAAKEGKLRTDSLGLYKAPGVLHAIKAHGGSKAKTAKSHRQLKPVLTNPSTYHQKCHVSDGECAHVKSPAHEVMIPAGRVYKVVKVHKVKKDGKQALSDAPWEYVWKYNDSSAEEQPVKSDDPMAQNSSEVIRQPPPAINFVQVVKGPNLVLLNQPQKQSLSDQGEQQKNPPHSPPQPKREKKEGKK